MLDVELEPVLMVPVTGRITDGSTGEPISQAQLSLSSDPDYSVFSDNNGYFSYRQQTLLVKVKLFVSFL